MLRQSPICYQQKHLWLIGHIRTLHWLWCTHAHAHTHTGACSVFLFQKCMLTKHLHLLTNIYHILSHIQIHSLGTLTNKYSSDTRPVWCAVNVFCEGLKGALERSFELRCGYPHVTVLMFINDWTANEGPDSLHFHLLVVMPIVLLKIAFFTCGFKSFFRAQ